MSAANKILKIALALVLAAFLGFALGRWGGGYSAPSLKIHELTEGDTGYKFISPLLDCGDYQPSNLLNNDARNIQNSVQAYIGEVKQKGLAASVSVYFRDLNNGPYVNINSDQAFVPGSLLKIPIAISLYKQAEKEPALLQRVATYKPEGKDYDAMQHFDPQKRIAAGQKYSVEDLMRYMLTYSDNNAAVIAYGLADPNQMLDTYSDLGIQDPDTVPNGDYTITTKSFGSFFRILYNASYISQEHSEHILSLLAGSPFVQGIVAGVPKSVVVSHKFGEKTLADGTRQLHDCGIVYKSNQPYALCIMTRGGDFDGLAAVISHISSMIFVILDHAAGDSLQAN